MQYFPHHGHGLHQLIYVSRANPLQTSEDEIARIVANASTANRARAVTGVLLAYDGWFLQALEGAHATLKPLYETIAADPRHSAVTLKGVEGIAHRAFGRWGMKQGRKVAGGEAVDFGQASYFELLTILKMAALLPVKRAA